MKFYKNKNSNSLTHILLETIEEVNFFIVNKDIFWKQSFIDFQQMNNVEDKELKSKLISHSATSNVISSLAKIQSSLFNYEIPVSINVINDFYNKKIIEFFHKYNQNIFVNKSGGYCYKEAFNLIADFDLMSESSIKDFFIKESISFDFTSSENEIIVFENDPSLDPWTVRFFKNKQVPYICNLREVLASNKFEKTCLTFSKNYSKKAFIYTTGLDFNQIIDYTQRAYNSGINDFTWWFTADFKKERELVDFLSTLDITYSINYNAKGIINDN